MIGRRRSPRLWTWEEVRNRILAVYRSERDGRSRTAVLVWQGDDRQVSLDGSTPALLAFTMDVEEEADADNVVALTGFDSLEPARAHCLDWAGADAEVGRDTLGEAAQIAVYASIRDPGFADRG